MPRFIFSSTLYVAHFSTSLSPFSIQNDQSELTEACRKIFPDSYWRKINPEIFSRIYSLSLYDVVVPKEQYDFYIQKLTNDLSAVEHDQRLVVEVLSLCRIGLVIFSSLLFVVLLLPKWRRKRRNWPQLWKIWKSNWQNNNKTWNRLGREMK